ncbi:NADP-dependent malic enzyme [Patescibacteria group bacterium]|nr:NADP-dependent malic enzyme [Patescibacteria group bacterium]
MDVYEKSLKLHRELKGKLRISSKKSIKTKKDLSLLYTPGVAEPSKEIAKRPSSIYAYTGKGNSVAVVSDGSSVLGLGNIGGAASLPVMEGKCAIFSEFAGIDAFPIVLATKDVGEIVATVKNIAPGFGGINLEDISAPRCFEIEEKLQDLKIPVFHDDQHGTAIVVLAALINALKVVEKNMSDIKVVIFGAGAAGIATAKLIKPKKLIMVDSKGTINSKRKDLNKYKMQVLKSKKYLEVGSLEKAFEKADVFVGVSGKGKIDPKLIKLMNSKPIIFALSNPNPEIMPDKAKKAGAVVVATGRSDFENQVNNALAFPGIFKGALEGRVKRIDDNMKITAALAIADLVPNPTANNIIPSIFNKNLVNSVANAVKKANN